MTTLNQPHNDLVSKVAIPLLTAGLIGLGGWVWSTASSITLLQADLVHKEEELDRLETKQVSLVETVSYTQKRMYGMERDIEYIKEGIDDIKTKISELKE